MNVTKGVLLGLIFVCSKPPNFFCLLGSFFLLSSKQLLSHELLTINQLHFNVSIAEDNLTFFGDFFIYYYHVLLSSHQVRVVAFSLPQLTQASFIQKNQTLQNRFLISVTLRWHRVSVACKNQSFKS